MRAVERTLLLNLLLGVTLFGVVELVYSALAWLFFPSPDIWIFEEVGRTVRFDAIRGYTLTRTPSRFARITHGDIEYVGEFRGNAEGMPDRDDFTPERPPGAVGRYAVFGDSFSSAQFLATNWPDRAEDLLRDAGMALELLNFSTHGGGLANWVRNLQGILAQDKYEVDGLIFAVYGDDLERKFTLAEGRHRERFSFARVPDWNPADYPRTYAQARDLLERHEIRTAYILNREEFEAALAGDWEPERFWEFRLLKAAGFHLSRLWQAIQDHIAGRLQADKALSRFNRGQLRHIETIRQYAASRNLPVWIVLVPGQEQAAGEPDPGDDLTREFATRTGAEFIDGRLAFAGFEPDALQDLWFGYDEHWNQAGSDAFAAFMATYLLRMTRARQLLPAEPSIP